MSVVPQQRPGQSRQDYQTPKELLIAIKDRLHIKEFAWDLAASQENKVCDGCYTEEDDALVQNWNLVQGAWNWLNPPFADIESWVAKAATESMKGAQTVMLLPASVGSSWFKSWVWNKCYILLLNGRLCFIPNWRELGFKSKPLYPKDCMLLLYSPAITTGIDVWSWNK